MSAYAAALLKLDDEMVALGRPVPPAMSWLRSKPGLMRGKEAWDEAGRVWRSELAEWEARDPAAAKRWVELREQYIAEEERLEQLKWKDDEFNYQLLCKLGFTQKAVDDIRRPLDDRSCFRAAQSWLVNGTQWCLVLIGGPGSGKTVAATWAAHQLMMRGFRPLLLESAAMVDAPMWGAEAELKKRRCRETGLLVIDDLGCSARERDPKNPPKAWLDWLDDVLANRHGNGGKTIITSNRPTGWLAGWLGERLADRVNEGHIHHTSEPSMRGAP